MIDFINVRKSFVDKDILKDANFRINKSERAGVVGPNGAGKSTLFNMIIGETEPDKGEINLPKGMRLGYLKQQLESGDYEDSLIDFTADAMPEFRRLHHEIDQIESKLVQGSDESLLYKLGDLQSEFEDLGGYEMRAKAEAALSGLGFPADDFSRPLKAFSGGWQMRAGLAQTLILDPDILLLDEPSNYLDIPAIEWMQRYLKNFKGTLLLISHDRFLLNSLTNVTIEVNAGLVNRYVGDYDYYVRERKSRFQSLQAAKENQDKRRDQLEKSINRFRAKSTKASQVQSWVKTLEKMEEIDVPDQLSYSGTIKIPPAPASGAEIIRLEGLGHAYKDSQWILRNVDLCIERGDKIGIIGYNGMGKTTLLRILAGQMAPTEGKRILGHKVIVGYQAQEFAEVLLPGKSLYDIVRNSAAQGSSDKDVWNVLGSFGFQGESVHKLCGVLSGGEKIRLAFARIFSNPPNLLILDEPTTHLDIVAREALQEAIQQYKGTVCMVSHDIEFMRNSATTILAMDGKKGVRKYFGDYDYYHAKIAEQESGGVVHESPSNPVVKGEKRNSKEDRRKRAEIRKRVQDKKKELEKRAAKVESDIESWDEEKTKLMAELVAKAPGIEYASVNKRLKDLDKLIDSASTKWNRIADELDVVLNRSNDV